MEIISSIFCFEVTNKKAIVDRFYKIGANTTFHSFIHKRGGTIEENIQDTLDSISEDSKMYVVNVDGKLAAYFVWHKTDDGELVLEGFHVMPEFRTKEFLTKFWQLVKEKFKGPIITGICCKNEPALKSLFKAGFKAINVVEQNNHVFIILKCD